MKRKDIMAHSRKSITEQVPNSSNMDEMLTDRSIMPTNSGSSVKAMSEKPNRRIMT